MSELLLNNFLLANQTKNALAAAGEDFKLTFAELQQRVYMAATSLIKKGIQPNDKIGLIGNNDIDYIVNVLALWQIEAVPVLISTRLTEPEILQLLSLAECNYVLINKIFENNYKNLPANILYFPMRDDSDIKNNFSEDIDPEKTAVIIFTSGTTESIKGVKLSFNSLYQSARIGNQLLRHSYSDRWLASLPFYHIGGFSIITRSLLFGVPFIIPVSPKSEHLAKAMNEFNPTLISLVTPQLKILVENKIKPNSNLKLCLLGGGFTDEELMRDAIELNWNVAKVYGSTETASFVAALTPEAFNSKPRSAGRQLLSNKILIVNDEGKEVEPYGIGEIKIFSSALMKGYIENQRHLNKNIQDGFYLSGDIGYLDEDGYLFIEYRKNDLISSGGEKVNAAEVETAIKKFPSVIETAVYPLKDKEWGEIAAASIVTIEKNKLFDEEKLRQYLKTKIAAYKIPKKIFIEDELPKSELGKVRKSLLIKKYSDL